MLQNPIRIAVIGAGGLGTPAAWQISSQWNSQQALQLTIFDPDVVELSNLNRQILFGPEDLGFFKAEVLAKRLRMLAAANVDVQAQQLSVNRENVAQIVASSDLVLECSDSVSTKFLVNDFCLRYDVPFCYGGAVSRHGQLLWRPHVAGACLRCIYGSLENQVVECQETTCRQAGILGPHAGMIGFLQGKFARDFFQTPVQSLETAVFLHWLEANLQGRESQISAQQFCVASAYHRTSKRLDLRAKKCPDTLVYTKLALEELSTGERLYVHFQNTESQENVAISVTEEGYEILKKTTSPSPSLLIEHSRISS